MIVTASIECSSALYLAEFHGCYVRIMLVIWYKLMH